MQIFLVHDYINICKHNHSFGIPETVNNSAKLSSSKFLKIRLPKNEKITQISPTALQFSFNMHSENILTALIMTFIELIKSSYNYA